MKRVGILTGGGDCPGLNAVIRAAVRTLTRDHSMEVLGIQLGFEGLLTKSIVPLTLESIRGILPKGGTLLRTTNRGNPFEYPTSTGECEDRSEEVIHNIRELGIEGIIAIGGDGTLKIAQRLCDRGIPMVAVPKTIDNDLAATDYTFGFQTAVAVATDAVDRLHSTAESHDRVMILEVMGRNAGWIALYSGIAGGADIILIQGAEAARRAAVARQEGSAAAALRRHRRGRGRQTRGRRRGLPRQSHAPARRHRLSGRRRYPAADRSRNPRHGLRPRAARRFAQRVRPHPGQSFRQGRGGKYAHMVAARAEDIVSVPIRDAVSRPKYVDPQGQIVAAARSLGISFGDGR